jgi:hypothetical protein
MNDVKIFLVYIFDFFVLSISPMRYSMLVNCHLPVMENNFFDAANVLHTCK